MQAVENVYYYLTEVDNIVELCTLAAFHLAHVDKQLYRSSAYAGGHTYCICSSSAVALIRCVTLTQRITDQGTGPIYKITDQGTWPVLTMVCLLTTFLPSVWTYSLPVC